MNTLPEFIRIAEDQEVDLNRIVAQRLTSDDEIIFIMDGHEPCTAECSLESTGLAPRLHTKISDNLSIDPAAFVALDPRGFCAGMTDASSTMADLYLHGAIDPIQVETSSVSAWRSETGGLFFKSGLGLKWEDIVAWERNADPVDHLVLYCAHGPRLTLMNEDHIEAEKYLRQIAQSFFPLSTMCAVKPEALVAIRRQLPVRRDIATDEWVAYVSGNHLIPFHINSVVLHQLNQWKEWMSIGSEVFFNRQCIVATVSEKALHPGADERLGLYLADGHELNLYGTDQVSTARSLLQRPEPWIHLPASRRGFNPERIAGWRRYEDRLDLTLAYGPGISIRDAQEKEMISIIKYERQTS